jgi:hypothetical protein
MSDDPFLIKALDSTEPFRKWWDWETFWASVVVVLVVSFLGTMLYLGLNDKTGENYDKFKDHCLKANGGHSYFIDTGGKGFCVTGKNFHVDHKEY